MATVEEILIHPITLLLVGGGVSAVLGTWLAHFFESRRKDRDFKVQDRMKERELLVQEFWKQRDIVMENRRKEHEIKVEIVSKMDEAIMQQIGKASLLITETLLLISKGKKSPTEDEKSTEFKNIHNWYTLEARRIQSKLNTYFPETDLNDRWDTYACTLIDFISALLVYVYESDQHKDEMMKPFLEKISKYIKSTGNKKYEEDGLVNNITSKFNDELVPDVMAMFFVESDSIRRDIMKARINFLNVSSPPIK
jgi:hypothetical protein